MHFHRFRHGVSGLSLIELMIAMVIGLVLLLGLIQVLSASRRAYQLANGVARTQENARFAVDFIQRDLRMAGHMGCVNDQAHMAPEMPGASDASRQGLNLWFLTETERNARSFNTLVGNNFPLRFDLGLQGFEANGTAPGNDAILVSGNPAAGTADKWSPALPNVISALNPVAGSDIVVVRFLSRDGVPATLSATSATSYTVTPEAYGKTVATTDLTGLFALADCKQVSVFASNAVNAATGAITVDIGGSSLNKSGMLESEWNYDQALEARPMLYRAETVVYYVAAGAGIGADGTKPPSLWRARAVFGAGGLSFEREELVEGIESLQLLYGMDEHLPAQLPRGNMTRTYVASVVSAAANPDNAGGDRWRRIGTAQIGLLMRSADPAAAAQSTDAPRVLGVDMLRGATDANRDAYYRSVYETTVALRNRLFGN